MVKRIAIINSKGGSSKSTTATNLSGHIASRDNSVLLVDCDKNRSVLRWSQQREKGGEPELFQVRSQNQAMMMGDSKDFILFDTAAQITPSEIAEIAEHCDLVIVPTLPTRDSLLPTLDTVSSIKQTEVPYRILFTQCQSRTADADAWREDLEEGGYDIMDAMVRFSVHVSRASANGLIVQEMNSKERQVASDFEDVCAEVLEILQ